MKKFTATFLFLSLFLSLIANELVMIKTSTEKEIKILSQLENLTVNYLGNGFIIGTKTGIVKQEYVLIENNAWQPGQNYFLVFVNKTKNSSYITGIESYSQILYQTEDLTFIRVSDQKLSEVSPPVDGSLTKILNKKVKLPLAKISFPESKADPDPFIVARLAEVDTTLMQTNLQHLQDYGTRNAYNAQSVVAQNWIKSQFESYGLSTQLFDFTMPGGPASDNVIATKTGTLYPDEYVIIGGHYDSYSYSGGAPGADDNASGTCGVLEVARILAPYDFDRTIIFCAFSGEEYGLYGSAAYATWCDNNDLNILGYLNMDMIGYLRPGDPIHTDIIAPASAQPLVDFYTSVVNLYLPDFIIEPGMLSGGDSDHTSFNNHGFMGIFPFEDSQYYSPFIHTSNDLIGNSVNNFTQVGVFTKAIIATTVSLANMVPIDISVNPLSFEVSLPYDATVIQQLNISNSGDPNMTYSITKQYIEDNKAPLTYCTAGGGCDEYISSITFNTLTNTSGTCSSGGYSDYTSMSTTVEAGQSYTFSYVIGNFYPTDDIGVWIDWNQNEVFTDAGENVVCAYSVQASGTYTITVPENAPAGATRMRVRIKYFNDDCGSSCANATYGEVEDYTIIVNSSVYNWLTVSPSSGTVSSQGTIPITVTFNSEGLAEGDYYANLKISSNDPDEPMVTIPCTLHVVNQIHVDLKALLEGPFAGIEMQTSLNTYGMLPLNQPFNSAPWNYSGTESVPVIPSANVVDWILVELRDATTAATATSDTRIARQAAFLLKDGSIVGMDGTSILQFNNSITQQLFVNIYHRNHLGILSNSPLSQVSGVYAYNFSSPAGQAFGTDAQKQLVNDIWGMISGDANADGTVGNNDFDPAWIEFAGEQEYSPFDLNLDGQINNVDKDSYWIPNLGNSSSIPE
jgi:hypothetical protein